MLRKICLALIALAGLSSAVPAQTFNLPEIGIQTSGPCRQLAVRNQNSKAMVPLGCLNLTTGIFDGAAQLPDFTMSSLGVLPDTGVDVAPAIVAAAAKLPATGARLKLACGLYLLSSTAIITNSYLHIQGGGQNCTRLRSTAGFATGDVLKLTGSYSGISDVAFEHVATDTNSVRTAGYTLNLANGFGFARNISMRNCFVCIRMGAQGGWSSVDHVMLQYMADGVINPGSGGILVENDSIGPANWINHAIIMSNFVDGVASNRRYPGFAVKLTNTGETVISDSDFISNRTNLLIQPGAGQTVQATRLNSSFLDSAQADNFAIVPTASGYVFDVDATGSWITNTSQIASAINTNGFRLDASGNTTLPPGIDTGIRGVRWNGGVIASTTGKTGVGVLCADATPQDVTVRGTTISGWHIGVDIAPGCSHWTIADNAIGAYSPFNVAVPNRTNNIGVRVQGGSGNYINVHDNRLWGNATAAIGFSATGFQNVVHDNPGYNPVGALQLTVGASPWTFTNGPTSSTINLVGGSGVSVAVAAGNGSGNVTLCNTTPCTVNLSPYQALQTYYTTGPSAVQTIH